MRKLWANDLAKALAVLAAGIVMIAPPVVAVLAFGEVWWAYALGSAISIALIAAIAHQVVEHRKAR